MSKKQISTNTFEYTSMEDLKADGLIIEKSIKIEDNEIVDITVDNVSIIDGPIDKTIT
jgi:competence protein ComGC